MAAAMTKIAGDVNYVGRLFQSGLRVLTAIVGNGAPSSAPSYVGQFYLDIVSGDQYQAYSLTSWQKTVDASLVVGVALTEDVLASAENLRANRSYQPPSIGASKRGQTNLGAATVTADDYASIAGGAANAVSVGGSYGSIGGGADNVIAGAYGTVPGGRGNVVNSTYGLATGRDCVVDNSYGTAQGYKARVIDYGGRSLAAGCFVAVGDAQVSEVIMQAMSEGATVSLLKTFGDGEINVPLGRTMQFDLWLVGREFEGDLYFAAKSGGVVNRNTADVTVLSGLSTSYWYRPNASYTINAYVEPGGSFKIAVNQPAGPNMYWKAYLQLNWTGYL